MSVKRSGDVTAAAVVLFCGSGLLLLMTVFLGLGAMLGAADATQGRAGFMGVGMAFVVYGGLAGWGIATGIGVLKLHSWARISMIVMSGLAIAGCAMSAIGMFAMETFLKGAQQVQAPPGVMAIVVVVFGFFIAVPLAIAIWWMILFTRKRVALEFASHGAAEGAVFGQTVVVSAEGDGSSESAQLAGSAKTFAEARVQIPISVRVIAVLYIAGSAMIFPSLEYMRQMAMPTVILGVLVEGWGAQAFFAALGLVQLGVCIAVLKRRAWALDVLIGFLVFGVVNSLSFGFSPAWKKVLARTVQIQQLPPGVSAETMNRFMDTFLPLSLIAGAIFCAVMLYFLLTRRKVFRAVCAGRNDLNDEVRDG